MSEPLVIVLLVLAADAGNASLGPIVQTTHESLGDQTRVVIESRPTLPGDAEVPGLEKALGAQALVELIWLDTDRRRVRVRMHVADSFIDREIAFARNDDASERGRTIGLAIASTLPAMRVEEKAVEEEKPPAVVEKKEALDVPRSPTQPGPPTEPKVVASAGLTVAPSFGSGTSTGGFGSFGWVPHPRISLQAQAEGRVGDVPALDARLVTVVVAARAGWRQFAWGPLALGWQVGAGLMHDDLARHTESGTLHRGRWVPVVSAQAEIECRMGHHTAATVAIGPELALGQTRVIVGEREITALPPIRWLGQASFRVRF